MDTTRDLDKVAESFHLAERHFFKQVLFEVNGTAPSKLEDLHDLSLRFADVSFFANRDTPYLIAVSAEAVEAARKQLQQIGWFSSTTVKKVSSFTHEYEQLSEDHQKLRMNQKKEPGGLLAPYDFFIRWSQPDALDLHPDQGRVPRKWSPLRSTGNGEYADERLLKVQEHLSEVDMLKLAQMLIESAVEFEFEYGDSTKYNHEPLPNPHIPAVQQQFRNAGPWFALFAKMPYDSTYGIEALLDCLSFLMRRAELLQAYMVDAV